MSEISRLAGLAGLRTAQIFREIIRSGSTRRASIQLGITQSAVSQHLKLFEEAVGERLFVRDRRGLIPTTHAVEIYNRIDRYFETLGRIENEIHDTFAATRNILTISAPHITCLTLVPKIALDLSQVDPLLELHVKAQRYDQVAHSLLTGEADIGVSRLPLDERFFQWLMITECKSVCVMHKDHHLSGKEQITEEDIYSERLISIEREYASNPMGMNVSSLGRGSAVPNIYVDAVGLGAYFIANGSCIAIENEFTAMQYTKLGLQLSFVPFQPAATYRYVVFWRRGNEKGLKFSKTIQSLLENEFLSRGG